MKKLNNLLEKINSKNAANKLDTLLERMTTPAEKEAEVKKVMSRKDMTRRQAINALAKAFGTNYVKDIKKESLDEDKRAKYAKSMYKKSWDELDDRQRQTIIKLMKNLPESFKEAYDEEKTKAQAKKDFNALIAKGKTKVQAYNILAKNFGTKFADFGKESFKEGIKGTDYKVTKKCFLGDVGNHIVIDWKHFDSPKWYNLTKNTTGSPVSTDEVKCLKQIGSRQSFNPKESFKEAVKVGDKVHSPSGYGKVIKVDSNKVTVRSNDPAGDFEYSIDKVQKESFKELAMKPSYAINNLTSDNWARLSMNSSIWVALKDGSMLKLTGKREAKKESFKEAIASDAKIKKVLQDNDDWEAEEAYDHFIPVRDSKKYDDKTTDAFMDKCVKIAKQLGR